MRFLKETIGTELLGFYTVLTRSLTIIQGNKKCSKGGIPCFDNKNSKMRLHFAVLVFGNAEGRRSIHDVQAVLVMMFCKAKMMLTFGQMMCGGATMLQ